MKTCTLCGEVKDLKCFEQKGLNKNGTKKYRGACRACRNKARGKVNKTFVGPPKPWDAYHRAYYHKHKAKLLAAKRAKYIAGSKQCIYIKIADLTPEQAQKARARRAAVARKRRANCVQFMLACRYRTRLYKYTKNKSIKSSEFLGCSWNEYAAHIEAKFQPGMSWANQHEWQVDHVVPLSWFDLRIPEQAKQANHYTNLQPMWASDNMKKGNRYAG